MIYVLLPAYNEEKSLPPLLDTFAQLGADQHFDYRILIVDDGSCDNTAAVATLYAEHMPLDILKHEVNKGLGAAIRTGLQHLAKLCKNHDLVVTMDADNTHNPNLVPAMCSAIDAGADVVIASRYAPGGGEIGLNIYRKLLSRGASFLLNLYFPVEGARDYTCGYRMYRAPVIRRLIQRYGDTFILENSFVCMAELLIKAAYLPARVTEVPLVLRYDLKKGASKMKKVRTILRYLRFIVREKRHGLKPSFVAIQS